MPLKNPGTARRSGTCSLSYHSLNSASTSGSTPVHTASNPIPVFRAIGSPPSHLTAARANRTTSTTAFAIHARLGGRLIGTLLRSFDPAQPPRTRIPRAKARLWSADCGLPPQSDIEGVCTADLLADTDELRS